MKKASSLMDYVKTLRAAIGHMPLVLAGTSVLLFRKENGGEFLMQRRSDNGLWSMPGGMIEPGESAEETACREVHEETGWRMTSPKLISVVSGRDSYYRYPNGDEVFSVTVVFAAIATLHDQAEDPTETTELQWWPLDREVPQLSPPTANMFRVADLNPGSMGNILATL